MTIGEEDMNLIRSAYVSHSLLQIRELAGVTLSVFDRLKAAKKKKAQFSAIGRTVCEITIAIVTKADVTTFRTVSSHLRVDGVLENIRIINDQVEKHVKLQGFVTGFIYGYSSRKTLHQCQLCLRDCFDILGLHFSLETLDRVRVLTHQTGESTEDRGSLPSINANSGRVEFTKK
ncbi:hypothetical protein NP233_g7274 [Leucocoprinus birnbaumii]|uniref:Uncharacterized protein n=1 Tax=Leucocoprinus birnbaumii TaxID=56174 RepID=A0AAD5VPN9_9AGAR|nr:hypothetical protein NP233_g7274 [Leucocoprinus birnbaumii]